MRIQIREIKWRRNKYFSSTGRKFSWCKDGNIEFGQTKFNQIWFWMYLPWDVFPWYGISLGWYFQWKWFSLYLSVPRCTFLYLWEKTIIGVFPICTSGSRDKGTRQIGIKTREWKKRKKRKKGKEKNKRYALWAVHRIKPLCRLESKLGPCFWSNCLFRIREWKQKQEAIQLAN